jgi:hypothetical protein
MSPVKYKLGIYITEGGILHSLRSENLKSCIENSIVVKGGNFLGGNKFLVYELAPPI